MSEASSKKMKFSIFSLCTCAFFAALVCVCTLLYIPLPIGYFNLGDIALLVSVWFAGPVWGTVAAALGSALADIISGYVVYAPATLVIKALMALCAYFVAFGLKKMARNFVLDAVVQVIAAVCAELVMVGGYLFYEAIILGLGAGAFVSIAGNALQGACGVVGGVTLILTLKRTGIKEKLLRSVGREKNKKNKV